MAASSIAAFWVVALLLIAVPGPDWAFVLGSGLRARSVGPAVGGLALGYTGITIVVAAGVGVLIARSPAVLTGLTIGGGCYLIWHGARTFARSPAPGAPAGAPARTGRGVLVQGLGVSALNPKGLLAEHFIA
jgi:threonine/homoserine/homoserine lactone efflux protein